MNNSRQWYVVYCRAQNERLANEQLVNQGFDTYLPFYKKIVCRARQAREVQSPLFPRYLFVAFDVTSERWRCINSTKGVQKLVMFNSEQPHPISSEVINRLKQTQDAEGLVSLGALDLFRVGESVRILEGAFVGYVAIYQKMTDMQRAEVLLNFLSSQVRMQIPVYAVEKVA